MTSEKTQLQIEKFESDDTLPLYIESQGQEGPAYLYLDTRDGDVYVNAKHPAHASSWGVDEHNGHVRRWRIPNNLTVAGVNQLLSDPYVVARLEAVIDGAEEYYDGNNYKTRLSEEAQEVSEELESYLYSNYSGDYDALEAATAEHYLNGVNYADCVGTEESHASASERLAKEALEEGFYVSAYDIESALDVMRNNLEDDEDRIPVVDADDETLCYVSGDYTPSKIDDLLTKLRHPTKHPYYFGQRASTGEMCWQPRIWDKGEED